MRPILFLGHIIFSGGMRGEQPYLLNAWTTELSERREAP